MTRAEALEIFEHNWTCLKNYAYTDNELDEALDIAIKALEQEPFMYKPCVAHQICHEDKIKVLDKIRAEIALLSNANPSYWHSGDMVEREDVFEIIDKYRAEMEVEK